MMPPIRIHCPYCRKTYESTFDDPHCKVCGEISLVGTSDGNHHSLYEISLIFERKHIHGELFIVFYRQDQHCCAKCGAVSNKKPAVCPGLIKVVKDQDKEIRRHPMAAKHLNVAQKAEISRWLKTHGQNKAT